MKRQWILPVFVSMGMLTADDANIDFFNAAKSEQVQKAAAYKPKNFYHLIGMPGFTDAMLTMHFKLYEGYVNAVNTLSEKIDCLQESGQERSMEYAGLKRMFGFEYDGMRLHELYFENLGGKRPINPSSKLYQKIASDFGSFENWRKAFVATGMIRGIGWSVLYLDHTTGKLFNVWVNEHQTNELVGGEIILAMDVWEHAYLTEYGTDRGAYIDAFMKNVNWNVAANRYDIASR